MTVPSIISPSLGGSCERAKRPDINVSTGSTSLTASSPFLSSVVSIFSCWSGVQSGFTPEPLIKRHSLYCHAVYTAYIKKQHPAFSDGVLYFVAKLVFQAPLHLRCSGQETHVAARPDFY